MSANRHIIKAAGLYATALVIACLVAGCAAPKPVVKMPEMQIIPTGDSVVVLNYSSAKEKSPIAQRLDEFFLAHRKTFTVTLPPPTALRGCAWSWPYTNALNGYFRIEATTNLSSPNWQIVTNTLWTHYVEKPIQQHYFRGWYMHNLYGMIPIRTGN